ncbi:MAG: prepilin-type N-terminal cleavage/methylation domain-containing protein [Minisyncoccia bacterium]
MYTRKKTNESGFTVIEVLVSAAVSAMIMAGIYTFMKGVSSMNRILSASIQAQNEARKVLKPMAGEIRDASDSSTGTYPIETAGNFTFTFYSNIDSDTQRERVRYFLDGTILKKGITQAAGSPLTYDTGTEVVTEVIHNIANGLTPIFSYYDRNYTGTEAALSTPIVIPDVRLVKINIIIDPYASSSPTPTSVVTQVSLRNLKDN